MYPYIIFIRLVCAYYDSIYSREQNGQVNIFIIIIVIATFADSVYSLCISAHALSGYFQIPILL